MECNYKDCKSIKIRARNLCSKHWNIEQYGMCINKCTMPAANSRGLCSNCNNRKGLPPNRRNKGSLLNNSEQRVCSSCKQLFTLEEFKKSHHDNRCVSCQTRLKKHLYLIKTYNISIDQWEKMLKSQNFVCKICKRAGKMCVDHDHQCCNSKNTCGKCIRGIICDQCNRAIGLIKDDYLIALNMSKYLERN